MRPNFLGDAYGETQRNENPVKQDFIIKYEPLDETNDIQNCYMTKRTTS